jgi:uncharacterized membrane protein
MNFLLRLVFKYPLLYFLVKGLESTMDHSAWYAIFFVGMGLVLLYDLGETFRNNQDEPKA